MGQRQPAPAPPRLPFEPPADSAELFLSVGAKETASRLRHLLDLRGIGLLTGEPGCGKTSACRRLGEVGQLPLLLIDEAHHLRHEVLDELRLLTNFGLDSERRLCLLLVGQSELRRRVAMAHHEALAQRVVVRYHLGGLQREELEPYLAHALRLAGGELPLFEPPACQALFQASHGLPRQVSALAHYSLAAAALAKARTVSAEHVQSACEEVRP